MNLNTNNTSALPMMSMKEVPTPNPGAPSVTALVKESGKITGYQLSNGQTLAKDAAVALAKQGGISGVGISERYGKEYLKSLPDGAENNNLSSLPTVSNMSM